MPDTDAHTRLDALNGQLALTGPSVHAAEGHLPVRGDLAHIALAGRYFVPHYAVPMPHVTTSGGASLREAPDPDAREIRTLAANAHFAVLDITGGWAWGQLEGGDADEDGLVGYVVMTQLEPAP